MTRYLYCLLPLFFGVPVGAQGFGSVSARWDREFSRIGGVAELPDGRVVIVDNRDGVVYVGDAGGGASAQLGRVGDGPNEYRRPFSVTRAVADTLLVYAQNRLVRIAPSGVLAGSHLFVSSSLGGFVAAPRGVDGLGRVYWDRVVIRDPVSGEIKRQQQYEIVRFRPGTEQVEVVATASDHAPVRHAQRFHPFAERDGWVVDPDGTIRIVQARGYAVRRVRDGSTISTSAPIPFRPIPITAADREALRREKALNPSGTSSAGRPAAGSGRGSPEQMARMRREFPDGIFPATKPPLVEGGVFRSPGGQLWVVRSPMGPSLHGGQIDVLDSAGRRVREIALPAGRHLIALDRRGVYLVREDNDGLQYLERYAWPTGLQ